MTLDNQTFEVDGTTIHSGTAIYDTKFDRALWVSEIDDNELSVEVAEVYNDDEPYWWSHEDDPTRVADGSRISIEKFQSLVQDGRFEISPRPCDASL